MKKNILISMILFVLIISSTTNVFALTTLYEKENDERISSGVVLKSYKRLTNNGWLSINILEVDLADEDTKVGLLNSENGLNTFQTVSQMASKNNVIAAINGDFFNGNYKNGNTIGLSISDGKLLTSTYYENETKDTFGSFILDEDNNAWFDYFTNKITLVSKRDDTELPIGEYNKISSNYEYPVLYTRDWKETSLGSTESRVLTELVVEDGKVKEIRYNEPATTIPEDGFVIATIGNSAKIIEDNFKVGTKVELRVDMDLDIERVKMAVSGGAMLVEKGKIPEKFASNISGSHPRTAIGLSRDAETLYLITVDGRQTSSIGMTQTELADFLIEKGIYNALNLDGGGSTTMVARRLGYNNISTINSPSGGVQRMVTNAIGIYNNSKTGKLDKIILKTSEENVFANCKRKLEVLGYDKYYNPVEVDIDDLSFSYDGVPVKVEDGVIIAGDEAGTATITAKKGSAKGSISIDVLSVPNELTITPKDTTATLGKSVEYKIIAKNKNGYYASIEADELDWKVVKGAGSFEDNKFTPKSEGEHIISVSAGKATAYARVIVGKKITETILNDFETENFFFTSYPDVVSGKVGLTDKEVYDGETSAKITYDFTTTDATRAAYLRFNDGISIAEDVEKINFYVCGEDEASDYIKLKLIDAKGVTQLVTAQKSVPDKWTKVTVDLSTIALPATLTDIYVVQDKSEIKNKNVVYVDNLSISKSSDVAVNKTNIPEDIKGDDVSSKKTDFEDTNTFKIFVYDNMKDEKTPLDKLTNTKIEQLINKNANLAIFTTEQSSEKTKNIKTEILSMNKYSIKENEEATYITIDVSNGGLRKTDYTQWVSLQKDIKNTSNKNIFILMKGTLESFTDVSEKQAFIDTLCDLRRSTSKNIWLIYQGDYTTYSMERGIKHLIIGNEWIDKIEPLEVAENTKCLIITLDGKNLTYEIKNIFEK